MSRNLATKFSTKVDERFTRDSQALMALNSDYEFTGDETVKVFSIPVVPMTDFDRNADNGYGATNVLNRNIQTMTITRDRAFRFKIDQGDKIQSEMVMDAGKALSRELSEVTIPEFDTYVFTKLASVATANGNFATTAITKSNAYEMLLAGNEFLGDQTVPDQGRVAFCSYRFANYLKQDPSFMRYGDASQDMIIKGVIGEVDGTKIVKVPSSRLPNGCAFILTHPVAATAPKQLEEYRIHDNPPGVSGYLVEGRMIYDCFVLDEKVNAIYYHGSQGVLRNLTVLTAASYTVGKSKITVAPAPETGNTWVYKTGTTAAAVVYGTALSGWTALASSGTEITPTSTDTIIQVAEVGADSKPLGVGKAKLNIG